MPDLPRVVVEPTDVASVIAFSPATTPPPCTVRSTVDNGKLAGWAGEGCRLSQRGRRLGRRTATAATTSYDRLFQAVDADRGAEELPRLRDCVVVRAGLRR